MADLTPEERERLTELERLATPPPWKRHHYVGGVNAIFRVDDDNKHVDHVADTYYVKSIYMGGTKDAEFIAASRNALPRLLDQVAALEARLQQAERECDEARQQVAEERAGAAGLREALAELSTAVHLADSPEDMDRVLRAVEQADAALATTAGAEWLAAVRGLLTMAARGLMTVAAEGRACCSGDETAAQAALWDALQRLKALVGEGDGRC